MSGISTPWAARPGLWFPLGATVSDGGTNFAVASGIADGMLLCLFDEQGAETRIPLPVRNATNGKRKAASAGFGTSARTVSPRR